MKISKDIFISDGFDVVERDIDSSNLKSESSEDRIPNALKDETLEYILNHLDAINQEIYPKTKHHNLIESEKTFLQIIYFNLGPINDDFWKTKFNFQGFLKLKLHRRLSNVQTPKRIHPRYRNPRPITANPWIPTVDENSPFLFPKNSFSSNSEQISVFDPADSTVHFLKFFRKATGNDCSDKILKQFLEFILRVYKKDSVISTRKIWLVIAFNHYYHSDFSGNFSEYLDMPLEKINRDFENLYIRQFDETSNILTVFGDNPKLGDFNYVDSDDFLEKIGNLKKSTWKVLISKKIKTSLNEVERFSWLETLDSEKEYDIPVLSASLKNILSMKMLESQDCPENLFESIRVTIDYIFHIQFSSSHEGRYLYGFQLNNFLRELKKEEGFSLQEILSLAFLIANNKIWVDFSGSRNDVIWALFNRSIQSGKFKDFLKFLIKNVNESHPLILSPVNWMNTISNGLIDLSPIVVSGILDCEQPQQTRENLALIEKMKSIISNEEKQKD